MRVSRRRKAPYDNRNRAKPRDHSSDCRQFENAAHKYQNRIMKVDESSAITHREFYNYSNLSMLQGRPERFAAELEYKLLVLLRSRGRCIIKGDAGSACQIY